MSVINQLNSYQLHTVLRTIRLLASLWLPANRCLARFAHAGLKQHIVKPERALSGNFIIKVHAAVWSPTAPGRQASVPLKTRNYNPIIELWSFDHLKYAIHTSFPSEAPAVSTCGSGAFLEDMKYAILIDGGFAKAKLGNRESPTTAEDITALVQNISQHQVLINKYLYRVYFYDAPPYSKSQNIPLNGGKHQFSKDALTISNKALHNNLAKEDLFALRMGEVRFRGWQLKQNTITPGAQSCQITADQLAPTLQQKGVDMRIGLDIASLSLKKQVDMIVLVTGDSDFVPPMKFARKEGIQLAIVTLNHGVHKDLYEHADFLIEF